MRLNVFKEPLNEDWTEQLSKTTVDTYTTVIWRIYSTWSTEAAPRPKSSGNLLSSSRSAFWMIKLRFHIVCYIIFLKRDTCCERAKRARTNTSLDEIPLLKISFPLAIFDSNRSFRQTNQNYRPLRQTKRVNGPWGKQANSIVPWVKRNKIIGHWGKQIETSLNVCISYIK